MMIHIYRSILSILLMGAFAFVYAQESNTDNTNPLARLEREILSFEKKDTEQMPPEDALLFVGSSSVRFWRTLSKDMAPLQVINRGFGGSTFPELLYYYDRIVTPYKPKAILVYEGDNDLTKEGMTPQKVLENLKIFHKKVQQDLPGVSVWFIAIKPSVARQQLLATMQETNALIESYTRDVETLEFLDVASPMLNEDGSIKAELFIRDNLHMNVDGYAIWKSVIKPHLLKAYANSSSK